MSTPISGDALSVGCGFGGCEAKPGEPCVNSVDGASPRDLPHHNRVVRAIRVTAPIMPGGESTSAQLRETQSALAASQADLTRVERERDQANELTDKIAAELRLITRERDSLARRCAVRFEETQALKAELASARAELEQLRNHTTTEGATS